MNLGRISKTLGMAEAEIDFHGAEKNVSVDFKPGFQLQPARAIKNLIQKSKIHFPLTQCTSLGFSTLHLHLQHRGAELEEPRQPWEPKPSPAEVIYGQS